MSAVDAIAVSRLENGDPLSLADLGGEAAILAARPDVIKSAFLPEIAVALLEHWRDLNDPDTALALVVSGLAATSDDITFQATLDVLMRCEIVSSCDIRALVDTLIERARQHDAAFTIRSAAVEALLCLALTDITPPYDLLALFTRLQVDDDPNFLYRMPRLIGAAFDRWHETAVADVLDRLTRVRGCEVEAIVERGMVRLGQALGAGDHESVAAGLGRARSYFAEAGRLDPERLDARAFEAVVRLLLEFAEGDEPDRLSSQVAIIEDVIATQALWRRNARPARAWLRPRHDAEGAWLRLGQTLCRVAAELEAPSWYSAAAPLRDALAVYTASRSFELPGAAGLDVVIRPRIEAAFLRREGLRAHIDQFLERESKTDPWREIAEILRARLAEASRRGDPPGKSRGAALAAC